MSVPVVGGINLNVSQTSYIEKDHDSSALEILMSMMRTLESNGEELPEGLDSNFLGNAQDFFQKMVDDLDPVSRDQFVAAMSGVELPDLDPANTAEIMNAIADGALEPKPNSTEYIQARREVDEFMTTFRNGVGEGSDARNSLSALPESSITREFVDPLFNAADAQEAKVEEMLSILDGYNDRVKAGQNAMNSDDPAQMKAYLLANNSELTEEQLADKTPEQLKEMIRDDIEHVGQLSETHQIRLQAAMGQLQVIYSTLAGVVDAIATATKGAAGRIGN